MFSNSGRGSNSNTNWRFISVQISEMRWKMNERTLHTTTWLYQIHKQHNLTTGRAAPLASLFACLSFVYLFVIAAAAAAAGAADDDLIVFALIYVPPGFSVYLDCPFRFVAFKRLRLHTVAQFLGIYRGKLITHKHLNECCSAIPRIPRPIATAKPSE